MGLSEVLGIEEAARARVDELLAERAHESCESASVPSAEHIPRCAASSARKREALSAVPAEEPAAS